MARVVNKRREEYDVYIGRGSRWGNPFRIDGRTSRSRAISRYRSWLWNKVQTGDITLSDLAALNHKRLGCYCSPLPCHGDVLKAAAAWAQAELDKKEA